jgi:two-component system sensor histidine kinase KdpD
MGRGPALLASVLGVVCFNFFFLPPIGALTIADPQNWCPHRLPDYGSPWVSSPQAKRRAEEAESGARD